MRKAQGSLEYLVIIAVVLLVAGVVVYLVTGSAGSSKTNILMSNCQAAAEQCHLLKAANPNTVCSSCETQCVDSASGEEIFPGAIACCKAGNSSGIYEGSTGCSGGPLQTCSVDDDCDDGNECTADSCVNGYCSYENNNGIECNGGAGECQNGECVAYQCTSDASCPEDTDCSDYSCDLNSHTCVADNAPAGTSCTDADSNQGECDGSGTCIICIDDDGDGYGVYGGKDCQYSGADCDDSNKNVNPGAVEVCDNGVDDDCDGLVDRDDGQDCAYWHVETAATHSDGYTSLVLDSYPHAHVSYYFNQRLYYTAKSSSGWSIPSEVTSNYDEGKFSSIALNYSSDLPVIFFLNDTGSISSYLSSSEKDSVGGWTGKNLEGSYSNVFGINSMFSSNGLLGVSYYADGKLYYYDGVSAVQIDSFTSTSVNDYSSSLAFDLNGNPYVSYYDFDQHSLNLAYSQDGGSTFNIITIDTYGDVGQFNSIALDSSNYVHIAYFDDSDDDLKYVWYDGSNWNIEIIDGAEGNDTDDGHVGYYASLKLDSNNYPHIAYYDNTNRILKYAHKDSSGWHFEQVGSSLGTYKYIDLELGSNEVPYIVYYSSSDDDVMFAWFAKDAS